jgi:hypothetical protein
VKPPAILFVLCSVLAFACLDIQATPAKPDAGDAGTEGGAPGAGGASFQPDACVAACLTGSVAGDGLFAALAGCYDSERTGACNSECDPSAPATAANSSCPIPGIVDPKPGCNACLKDSCCDELKACLANSDCLSVALCSANCQ